MVPPMRARRHDVLAFDRRATADPATQRQLGGARRLGASRQGRLRKYFLRKIRGGQSEPFYEKFLLKQLNIEKLKAATLDPI
jgi:hypothetical protein